MRPDLLILLSQFVLAVHLVIIAFNVLGLIAIPLGAWAGWRFVRLRWLRLLHLACLGIVAVQAIVGAACFLTIWQSDLLQGAGETASRAPLIQRWVESVIFWQLPGWIFTALYLAIFAYTVVLWRLVPPDPRRRRTAGP
jgi:hypothetical protein